MTASIAELAASATYLLTQDEWHECPWSPGSIASDSDLRARGAKLAGWGRDLSGLSIEERRELFRLLKRTEKNSSPEQKRRLRELHERLPFTYHRVPFLDLDANEKHPEFTRERAVNISLTAARALTKACQEVGLGTPRWAVSNLNGGLHGRLKLPPIPPSTMLSLALLKLVREAAAKADLPLLLSHFQKDGRPLVVLDDGLFNRKASARGAMWRVEGVKKPGPDKVYIPIELGEPGSGPPRAVLAWEEPDEADGDTIANVCRELEAEDEVRRAAEDERREAARLARLEREQQKTAALARGETWDPGSEWPEAWLDATVENNIEKMAKAGQGQRNGTLNRIAYTFGGMEAGGAFEHYRLSSDEIKQMLEDAAVEAGGHSREDIQSVLEIGWRNGTARPTSPPPSKKKANSSSSGSVVITTDDGRQVTVRFGKKKRAAEASQAATTPTARPPVPSSKKNRQEQKAFLEAVQNLVQHRSPIWNAARRAKLCGVYRNLKQCKGCDKKLGYMAIPAENAFCLHCSKQYLDSLETALGHSKKHLPDTVALAICRFPETTKKEVSQHRKKLQGFLNQVEKGLSARVRFVPSPSEILVYGVAADAPLIDRALGATRVLSREQAAHAIRLTVQKRRRRIMDYFEREDAAGLVADEWATEFVATSAGKEARKTLPWPNAKAIRQACREVRAAEKGLALTDDPPTSKCCGCEILYSLERKGKILSNPSDRPKKMSDVENRADADT